MKTATHYPVRFESFEPFSCADGVNRWAHVTYTVDGPFAERRPVAFRATEHVVGQECATFRKGAA